MEISGTRIPHNKERLLSAICAGLFALNVAACFILAVSFASWLGL